MALTFKATRNLPPYGLYAGVLTKIEDMGVQKGGPYGDQHQVKFIVEVNEIIRVDDPDEEEDAEEFLAEKSEAWAYATLTFGPRSNLRAWCQAIAGREIEDGEEFDASEIIGVPIRFTVEANQNGNPKMTKLTRHTRNNKKVKKSAVPPPADPEGFDDEEDQDF